jgi:ABC-type multidrug transport system permease subunit
MNNFLSLVVKDVKIFGRSKFSAIVAVLIPLIIVLLVGAAFSSSELQGVTVSVYSESYNELSNSIISNFESNSYSVVKEENKEGCIEGVVSGDSQICVVFPEDLSSEGGSDSVVFHVDKSEINLAYALVEEVRGGVSDKSSEISLDLVGELVNVLQNARDSLQSQRASLSQASESVGSIGSKANSASGSVPDLSSLKSSLEDAKSLAQSLNGSSSLVSEINSAISEVDSASASLEDFSDDVGDIKTDSAGAKADISAAVLSLDNVIASLESLEVTEAERIVSPITTEIKSVVDESTNWSFVFPTLLALMVLFGSTVLSSVLALRDKQSRSYFRNFITPTSDFTFIVAMYVSALLILIVQLLVLFSGLAIISSVNLFGYFAVLSIVLFVSASAFIFLGILIGHLFKSEEAVILVSISVVSLMIFFSNIILPIESILGKFQVVALYNPLVVSADMLRKALLFGQGIAQMTSELYILLGTFAACFVLSFIVRKLTKRKV